MLCQLNNFCKILVKGNRSDRGVVKSITKRDMNHLRGSMRKMLGAISARLFEEAGLPDVTKTTRNRLLRKVAAMKSPTKRG